MKYQNTAIVVRNKFICLEKNGISLVEYAETIHKNVDHYEIHWDNILIGKYVKLKDAVEVYSDMSLEKINLKKLLASWQEI